MGRKTFALLVTAIFIYVSSPLLLPVTMGGVLAVLFAPLLERLERYRFSPALSAALLTIAITLIVLLPTTFLLFFGVKAGFHQLQEIHATTAAALANPGIPATNLNGTIAETSWTDNLIQTPRVHDILRWITRWFPVRMDDLVETTRDVVRSAGVRLTDLLGNVITAVPGLAMAMVVVVVSVYFFLIDGKKLVMFFRRNSFFDPAQTEKLMDSIALMCRSVILASVLSGLIQALLETVFCVSTGTSNAALIGIVTLIASFIPVVGSSPITFAVAVQQFLLGRTTEAIVLAIGAVLIIAVDNVIRPWVLKGAGNLHPFIAFVAAFGGLQMFGFLGVFLGPIVAGLFVVVLDILLTDTSVLVKPDSHV